MQYRRSHTPGGSYFLTVVTHQRQPWLQEPVAVQTLGDVMRHVRQQRPFENMAIRKHGHGRHARSSALHLAFAP